MSHGEKSDLLDEVDPDNWYEVIRPEGAVVKKVVIYCLHPHDYFEGIQFYDRENLLILQAGEFEGKSKEIILEENERLIGVKARRFGIEETFALIDFRLITGRMP